MERGIGQLKRRFHVLHGEIRLSPDKACQVIVACCILHNICKDRQIPCPLDDGDLDDSQQDDGDGLNVQIGQNVKYTCLKYISFVQQQQQQQQKQQQQKQ